MIQWRGLNGSKGELNAFLSWLIVFNSGILWALAFLNSTSNAGRSEGIQWLERVLREYYTWATCLSSGLSLITRGSSPPCPDDFTVLDIQFCSSAQTGHVNYDNFILLLIIQLIHREYVPCDWIYTCFGSVIGIVCVAIALANDFDPRYTVSSVVTMAAYLIGVGYILRSRWELKSFNRQTSGAIKLDSSNESFPPQDSTPVDKMNGLKLMSDVQVGGRHSPPIFVKQNRVATPCISKGTPNSLSDSQNTCPRQCRPFINNNEENKVSASRGDSIVSDLTLGSDFVEMEKLQRRYVLNEMGIKFEGEGDDETAV